MFFLLILCIHWQVIDPDTQLKIKKLGRCLPEKAELQAKCHMESSWKFFKTHLYCHLIYRKRKDDIKKKMLGGGGGDRAGARRDDLIADVPLDNPPIFDWSKV